MSKFIGRGKELEKLNHLLARRSASLIIVKGRRRVGKSRLLEEFGKNFPVVYTFSGLPPSKEQNEITAQAERDEFARQFAKQAKNKNCEKDDWGNLFWSVAELCKQGRVLIILDEISWMGSKDLNFLGKLKIAWDLYFKKNDELILAICGSASAWIDKNILSSTGFFGRESLNLTLEELPISECIKFWGQEQERYSAYEKLKILSVTGGIPRYLEQLDIKLPAEQNIHELCFDKTGILFDEFEKIFSDLFYPKNLLYKNVVNCLSDGAATQSIVCQKLGLKLSSVIAECLDDLIKSGFVSRDYTWHIENSKVSKLSQYRLKDNYSRFYLKYILPNREKIESGGMQEISLANFPGWHSILGLQIENLILSNRNIIKDALKINLNDIVCDNPFFQRKTNKVEGCQIDYMIQTKYNVLYLCEIKYSKNEVGVIAIDEMREKIRRLKIPKYFSYRTVLIHVNGVSEALEDTQYFTHIIDLKNYL